MSIVDIRNVSFMPRFEAGMLKDFNLKIKEGTVNILTGDSMAGTKLALQLLNGLIPILVIGDMTGEVIVNGVNVAEASIAEMALHVGMVLENPAEMIVSLTVEEDIAFGLQNLGLGTEEIQSRVREAIERTRLVGYETRNPNTLSGGELQAAAIAGVLAMRPKLIALIDPIAPLDPVGKDMICDLIMHLNKDYGITFMISEPGMNIEPLASIAHRVIVMDDGAVVLSGTPEEVFSKKESWDLGLPQVSELFLELKKKNPQLPLPVTLDEAEKEVRRLARGRKVRVEAKRSKAEQKKDRDVVAKVRNLCHVFHSEPPVVALNGINLDIYDGDFIGLIGQNGGGKTTLAYHLLGLEKPTNEDSEIIVDGIDVNKSELPDVISHINYSFQNPDYQLFCETVSDELAFGLRKRGMSEEEIEKSIERSLAYFGISEFKDWYIGPLPRDVKTYVAEATIAAMDPRILVIDEPTGSLDVPGARKMMSSLRSLNEAGKTLLIITHDQKIVAEFCKRVLVIKKGQIILDGSVREVYSQPDKLAEAQIKSPQITQLAQRLADLGFPKDIVSVEEMVDLIKPWI